MIQVFADSAASAEERTRILLEAMTEDEKLALVLGYFSSDAPWNNFKRPEGGLEQSAGYIAGNVRLGIPVLTETDTGTGVASQPGALFRALRRLQVDQVKLAARH